MSERSPNEKDCDSAPSLQVTQLLLDWSNGDEAARDELMPLVYQELRHLAHRYMQGERQDHTLQTTDLIHEAYIRLVDCTRMQWKDRLHFFAFAAVVMRRILIDYARTRQCPKHGGDVIKVALDEQTIMSPERSQELLALDEALTRFAAIDLRKSRVVELRFFGGLTNEETAQVLNISANTVTRDWNLARAWLIDEIRAAYDS